VSPPTQQRSGPAPTRANPLPTSTSRHQSADEDHGTAERRQDVPVARGVAYPPAGRRRLWLLLVPRCPHCGHAHAHRGGPAAGVRESGCGQSYHVVVTR